MPTTDAREIDDSRLNISYLPATNAAGDLRTDVRLGLASAPKQLPPKYFYDEHGSRLFEKICQTPEYYPTRTEGALLGEYSDEIIDLARPERLIEFGSGSSHKTTHLLDACGRRGFYCRYQPVDVCGAVIQQAGYRLLDRHDWLSVDGLVGDYATDMEVLKPDGGPCLYLYLGGTIGNFAEPEAVAFLARIRALMRPQDFLLLGADRVKDPAVLHAAYNDASGYTAEFNANVLNVINRELDASFELARFQHYAFYNEALARIEMHLESQCEHSVSIGGLGVEIGFSAGETILTELSHKYTDRTLNRLLDAADLGVVRHFTPANNYYSLIVASPQRTLV